MDDSLTIVFGAGASFDCAHPANSEVDPQYRPPLTKDLFEFRPTFNSILAKYRRVETLSDDLRSRIQAGESIEDILRQYSSETTLQLKRQYWEIPFYLQELIWEVSLKYVRSGGTRLDTLFRDLVRSQYKRVLLLTLNYDLFIEKALERLFDVTLESLFNDCRTGTDWALVKLHGSVNWGRELINQPQGTRHIVHILDQLQEEPKFASHFERVPGFEGEYRFCNGKLLYPALAIPLGETKGFMCPKEHVARAKDFLKSCTDFLFIGFSAFDQDFFELFKEVYRIQKLLVVSGNKQTGVEVLARMVDRIPGFSPHSIDLPVFVHEGNFSNFVGSGAHKRFFSQ